MPKQTKGFSLAELMIAMFVLVVGIAGLIAALYWGTSKSDTGQFITQASNYARVLMEEVLIANRVGLGVDKATGTLPAPGSGVNDATDVRREIFATPFNALTTTYQSSATSSSVDIDRFRRNISMERLAAHGSTDTLGGNHYANMIRVTVRVYWNDGGTTDSDLTLFNKSLKLETVENL